MTVLSRFWRNNALSIVLTVLFVATMIGQVMTGQRVFNAEREEAGRAPLSLMEYLGDGHFISATFENWESEFLQMALFVLLTVSLRQRGSAESRPYPEEKVQERIDDGPAPKWAEAGGWRRMIYGHSLATSLFALFVFAFGLHWWGSWRQHVEERAMKGEAIPGGFEYLGQAQFWFESFQNWQSEFLSVAALVVLSIFLRQKNSPQSKALDAPHRQTGD